MALAVRRTISQKWFATCFFYLLDGTDTLTVRWLVSLIVAPPPSSLLTPPPHLSLSFTLSTHILHTMRVTTSILVRLRGYVIYTACVRCRGVCFFSCFCLPP